MSKATLIVIILILFSSMIFVQEKKKDPDQTPVSDPSFIEEIVVTGELVSETATVVRITKEQIKKQGAKNVAEALEFIPGAHVRFGGKGEAYIRIRGFRQREVALLIDGIPVHSPYDGQLDLSTIPVDSIERIDVVKGASSVIYGSNAMGGVINIITKKSDGTRKFNLSGDYGTGKTTSFGSSLQGHLGSIRYLISGNYFNQDHFNLPKNFESETNQNTGKRENSDRRVWSGKLSLGWDVGQQKRMSVNINHIDQIRGIPHHESDKKAKFWRFDDWQQGMIDIIYIADYDNGSFKSKVYYEYLNNVLDSYDDMSYITQEGKNGYTDTMKNDALGVDLFYRHSFKSNLLFKTGFRFRYDHNKRQRDIGEEWENYSMNTLSVPVELEWRSGKVIDFTAGTSLDVLLFDRGDTLGNKTTTSFNPQLGFIFWADKPLSLKLSTAYKTRFPTMKELFSSLSGNPELEPMKASIFELGLRYTLKNGTMLSISGFYNNLQDLISRSNRTTPYENIKKALFKGVEMGIEVPFGRTFTFDLFYTYLQAEDKSSPTQMALEHRPKHKMDARLHLKLPSGFYLFTNLSFVSSLFYYEGETQLKLDPHAVVDMKISKRFGDQFNLHLSIRNLFDKYYYESEGYPREGRMILGGIQYDLQQ